MLNADCIDEIISGSGDEKEEFRVDNKSDFGDRHFLFDRPEGFGASFIGDQVFKSTDGSFAAIPGGEVHPQAVAPGFVMYTCWMIRHLEGRPWHQTDRNEEERYLWLHERPS